MIGALDQERARMHATWEVGGHKLALGLEWSMAASKTELKQRLAELRKAKASVAVVGEAMGAATWVGSISGKAPKGALAGAGVLSLVVNQAVICQTIGNGELTWVCAILDGKPAPGDHDLVVPTQDATAVVSDHMALFSKAELYGDMPGASQPLEQLLERVAERVKDGSIKKKELQAWKVNQQGIPASSILMIILLSGMGAGGFIGWKEYQKQVIAKKAAEINAANRSKAAMTAQELEAEKARKVAEFNALVTTKREEFRSASRSGQVLGLWAAVTAIRQGLPVSTAGGYVPTAMKCTAGGCDVAWEGRGRFTFASDKVGLTGQPDTDLGTNATTRHALPGSVQPAGRIYPAADAGQLRLKMVEALRNSAGVSVEAAQPLIVAAPPGLNLQPQVIGHAGSIRFGIQGVTSLVRIEHVLRVLDGYPVTIKSISFSGLNAGPSIDVDASYQVPSE